MAQIEEGVWAWLHHECTLAKARRAAEQIFASTHSCMSTALSLVLSTQGRSPILQGFTAVPSVVDPTNIPILQIQPLRHRGAK